MNSLAEQIIVDVLQTQMQLPANSVWVRDQNRVIPNDNGLYLIVGMIDAQPLSVVNNIEPFEIAGMPPTVGMTEKQTVVVLENIQIDILSRSTASILRRWEVLAALRSFYCQQKQEENYFKIYRIPRSVVNTSDAEAGSNINRFSIVISVHSWYRKEQNLGSSDYYDHFPTRVDDQKTIGEPKGLIEFTLEEEA